MSVFSLAEIAYFESQRLGRLATVNAAGEPHVVPVNYHYNAELDTIDIAGWGMSRSKKLHDVAASGRAAFVVDDAAGPGHPRGIEVRGRAEALATGGQVLRPNADPEMIRIFPTYVAAWGIVGEPYHPRGRAVE
jgi:PPOX class F420-dependent enzyme/OxyR family protein